jgi:two-component system OmpR family response regulator
MRVLVVEDEADLRRAVAQMLREADYAVDEAANGKEGLYKANVYEYDAIVLDLMLPGIDGWQFVREYRRKHRTPLLILTARDGIEDRIRGLDSGADDYLVKPFALGELLARLRAVIRRAAGHAAPTIALGDVILDTTAKTVTRAGAAVVLTGREYSLVELLALNRGRVISRAAIYDHLFDENDDTASNLLEVHVHNVRRKLGKNFITTRRGLGYVIDV